MCDLFVIPNLSAFVAHKQLSGNIKATLRTLINHWLDIFFSKVSYHPVYSAVVLNDHYFQDGFNSILHSISLGYSIQLDYMYL